MNHTHEKWYLDLNEYIKQGEPDKAERSTAWKTAIGLQDVDGLKTSSYLLETAKEHIEGNINITDAQSQMTFLQIIPGIFAMRWCGQTIMTLPAV